MTWQPIDSAPRDGTEILAFAHGFRQIISWDVSWDHWSDLEGRVVRPTVWHPLPDFPTSSEAQP